MYLAYYLHWSLGEILDLPHQIRAQVIEQVGTINVRVNGVPLMTGRDGGTQ
ncbi:MAG TPA: hypothetical protein VJX10_00855 [Pseudonocardiaceae bacterium]|nr:hypothetical protein [Pseudonocardiaceae bacterium]